jgi:RNA polymerase sigma-70 factor (ECF subfamily)
VLVAAARGGEREALEELLRRHYDAIHGLCRRMLGNDADAQDATQQAMVAAVRSIARFDSRSAFGTWLYRIATNACLDELRRRKRRPLVGLPAGEGGASWPAHPGGAEPAAPGGLPGPLAFAPASDPADRAASKVDVDWALGHLPAEFRAAVVLRDMCDLPYEEIAALLGVPIGTVRSRIARARAALAGMLGSEPGNPPPRQSVQSIAPEADGGLPPKVTDHL